MTLSTQDGCRRSKKRTAVMTTRSNVTGVSSSTSRTRMEPLFLTASKDIVDADQRTIFRRDYHPPCVLGGPEVAQDLWAAEERLRYRCKQIVCGGSFYIALNEQGHVFTWGTGRMGQLGHGERFDRAVPKRVEFLRGEEVTKVCAGDDHAMALASSGRLFAWGKNTSLQVSSDRSKHVHEDPIRVPCNDHVTDIAAGGGHSLCLTELSVVYAWGSNEYGQSCPCSDELEISATPVESPLMSATRGYQFSIRSQTVRVSRIHCGEYYSACVREDGTLSVWGMALGHTGRHAMYSDVRHPKTTVDLGGHRVDYLSCGPEDMAVRTLDGSTCVWGSNVGSDLSAKGRCSRGGAGPVEVVGACAHNKNVSFFGDKLVFTTEKQRAPSLGLDIGAMFDEPTKRPCKPKHLGPVQALS